MCWCSRMRVIGLFDASRLSRVASQALPGSSNAALSSRRWGAAGAYMFCVLFTSLRTQLLRDALCRAGKKAVIKFWAPWCNKCRMIAPHVDELAVRGGWHLCPFNQLAPLQPCLETSSRPSLAGQVIRTCSTPQQRLCSLTVLLQDKHKGVTVASFDTTADELETLTAELGVKGLPQFRFYKASWLVLVEGWLHGVQARRCTVCRRAPCLAGNIVRPALHE